MNWEERCLETDRDPATAIEQLFSQQVASWPLLGSGVQGLDRATSKIVNVGGWELVAWHIPHRIRSTTAQVDQESIRERECFLCNENLPEEERAFSLNDGYVVTCNPFPILRGHVSVVAREHRPQTIDGGLGTMLELAAALPEYLVLYNGPECGASAPDHMHFQACRRLGVPLIDRLDAVRGGRLTGFPSNPLVLEGDDRGGLEKTFGQLMAVLRDEFNTSSSEPMVNVITVHLRDLWRVVVFPRLSHRPAMYYSGELTWSPGALDLAGTIVLPVLADLDRIRGEMLEQGFDEVSISSGAADRIAASLGMQ